MLYVPSNWFWIVGSDETQVYSSVHSGYVPAGDAGYLDWKQRGGYATRIASEPELLDVLAAQYPAGLPATTPGVPRTVTNFQARAAMMQAPGQTPGTSLFAEVDAALRAGKDSGTEGAIAFQAWEFANDFYRDGALINALAANFGQSKADIDALFVAASTIEA